MNNQSVGKGVKPMKAQLKVQKFMPLICELFKMFLLNPQKQIKKISVFYGRWFSPGDNRPFMTLVGHDEH